MARIIVAHVSAFDNGHNMATHPDYAHSCWCEPVPYWTRDGETHILVIEHHDYTAAHRSMQLAERAEGKPEHLAWIDRALLHAQYPEGNDSDG